MRTVAATRFFAAQFDSFEVIGYKSQLCMCAHGLSVSIDLLRPLHISLVHQQHIATRTWSASRLLRTLHIDWVTVLRFVSRVVAKLDPAFQVVAHCHALPMKSNQALRLGQPSRGPHVAPPHLQGPRHQMPVIEGIRDQPLRIVGCAFVQPYIFSDSMRSKQLDCAFPDPSLGGDVLLPALQRAGERRPLAAHKAGVSKVTGCAGWCGWCVRCL